MNVNVPLKQEVASHLPWLFEEYGFEIVEDSFYPNDFGNSIVTIASPTLWVRFVRDRGYISAEIASCSSPKEWWNLEHVCELISDMRFEHGFELQPVAELLRCNLSALSDLLGPKFSETKHRLKCRTEVRRQAFLKRFSS